ncbi:MAG: TonB-dependent receptor [Pseudomonadota bacterium]
MLSKKFLSSVALTALGVSIAGVAHAQSTASQIQENEIIVTGHRTVSANGLGVQTNAAKDVSIITQDYMRTQVGSSNFGQLINLLPGISYSSEDYTGVLSGDFRMHGFDGAHVSVTIDGSPVNDTGNYAIFPGEYLTSEVTERTTVNIGATEVDSPTASAVGGTVNLVSIKPADHPDLILKGAGGSYGYYRGYAQVDTGAIGPTGLTSYFSVNYTDAQKWKGEGDIERFGVDGRIYQPLSGSDFLSVALSWASDRPYFYQSGARSQLATIGNDFDYNPAWGVPTVRPGVADAIANGTGAYSAINDTNYWALHPNPVDFGQIRGQSRFSLTDHLTFTFDPSFFYTLANGGGATSISECDGRLRGKTAITVGATGTCGVLSANTPGNGVDLNGDGDVRDNVILYTPNNTNTRRWLLTSSLLWDLTDTQHFQLGYTVDYGMHRQTGEYGFVNQTTGQPDNVFGGKDGYGLRVPTADGSYIRGRDRFSIAELHQFSLNYIGEFLDDNLHVNVGVRDPHFERDLNQHCYTFNGTSAWCDPVDPTAVQTAYDTDVAANRAPGASAAALTSLLGTSISTGTGGTPNFRFPFSQKYRFDKLLPNGGITYRLAENHLFYLTYAQSFSAPKTDDLYASSNETVQPETSSLYGAGYRFQSPDFNLSVNLWRSDYKNRIVQTFDPTDPSLSIDRNVGAVQLQGVDFEGSWRPIENLTVYGSATFQDSKVEGDEFATVSGVVVTLPTRGKKLVLTPDEEFAARVQYDLGGWSFGLQGKYQGRRFLTDVNDDEIGSWTTFDFDARAPLSFINENTTLQLNVLNIFDKDYFTRSNTGTNFKPVLVGGVTVPGANPIGGAPFLFIGAPRTFTVTLSTKF